MLDIKQLEFLKQNIPIGSLYTNDYENSLNICPIDVQNFFDSYLEYLLDLQMEEEEYEVEKDISYYDTLKNLENWYECYEDDPLPYDKVYAYMREERIEFSIETYKNLCEEFN
mgnify:CR=1 FL=1